MTKLTKNQKAQQGKIIATKLYPLADALVLVKEFAKAKFDESIDVAVQLGIDAKKSDQVVRGAVVLPNGTGKTTRVAVFAQGAKADEARAAGADIVGMDDLAAMVKAGDTTAPRTTWSDFFASIPSCTATSIDSSNLALANSLTKTKASAKGYNLVAIILPCWAFWFLVSLVIYTPSTFTPMERAEPAMVRTAASKSAAVMSFILVLAISSN